MKQFKSVFAPVGHLIKYQDIVSATCIQKLHVDGDTVTKSYTGGMLTMLAYIAMTYIFMSGFLKMVTHHNPYISSVEMSVNHV